MSSIKKFEIENFDGKISFNIWKVQMNAVLTQSKFKRTLDGKQKKPSTMTDEQCQVLDEKALSTIQLYLTKELLREVIHEASLYMTKSLANKLRLKERLSNDRSYFYPISS